MKKILIVDESSYIESIIGTYKYVLARTQGKHFFIICHIDNIHSVAVLEFMQIENIDSLEISGGGKFSVNYDQDDEEFTVFVGDNSGSFENLSYKKDVQSIVYGLAKTAPHYVNKCLNENYLYPDENYIKYSIEEIKEIIKKVTTY